MGGYRAVVICSCCVMCSCFSEHSSSLAVVRPLKLITDKVERCTDGPMTSAEIE